MTVVPALTIPLRTASGTGRLATQRRLHLFGLHRSRFRLASTAAAAIQLPHPEAGLPSGEERRFFGDSPSPASVYRLKASVLLSRPPQITQDLTPFEKAYFLYQRRLNERLALPFTRYFYYQRGTPGDVSWKRKIKDRLTAARDIGKYNAYGQDGWNDELLVGEKISEPSEQLESLIQDAEVEKKNRGQAEAEVKIEHVERPMPRWTDADEQQDRRSLSRALNKTLSLVVKGKGMEAWSLPTTYLVGKESLHSAAERLLVQAGGRNMNTWVVGNMPIGHQVYRYPQRTLDMGNGSEVVGDKTFFMKARIMAGQANLKDNEFELQDYQWLAKDELQRLLHPCLWAAIKNSIADR